MQSFGEGDGTPEDVFMATILELARRMRRRLPGDELDHSLLPVLRTLAECGAARHTVLAEKLGLDASTVSRKIRHLEERGLVRVSPDAEDGRARQVELLPEGQRALEQLLAQRRDVVGAVLARWPEADRALLRGLLTRFNADLTAPSTTSTTTSHHRKEAPTT